MKTAVAAPHLRRTAVALGALFLLDAGIMGEMSGGVLCLFVAVIGVAVLLVGALWAAVRGGAAMARSRAMRAGIYVVLGVSALAALRFRAKAFEDFHQHLMPGMSVQVVLERLDALYAQHPRRWTYIRVWGTTQEFRLEDVHKAAQTPDPVGGVTWYGSTSRTPTELEEHAKDLAKARQIWFTFRTGIGYLQFFVVLDNGGRVQTISNVTGHQV